MAKPRLSSSEKTFGKLSCLCFPERQSFCHREVSDEISSDNDECDCLGYCNEMHWHRESLHKCPHVDRRTIPRATQTSGFSCNRESKVHWHGFRFHIATLRNYQLQGFHVLSEHNIHNRLERFLLLFPTSSVWSQIFFNNTFQHPECRGNIRIQSSPNMPDTEGVFKKHGTMPLSSFVLLFWKRLFFHKIFIAL